ncbi:MAG: Hpt domain-containing protein [Flavobacteriales bacterium]|nr:Hpt domain-containing protein [Flavobacteriales bacterium]
MLRTALFLILLHASTGAMAITNAAQRDSVRLRIVTLKAELLALDSAGRLAEAVSTRLKIAELVPRKEGISYLTDAAALADSLGDPELGIEVRSRLLQQLREAGDSKRALQEATRIIELERALATSEGERHLHAMDDLVRAGRQEKDSLVTVSDAARRDAEGRVNDARENAELWMYIALGTIAIALVAVVLIVLMNGRALRRQRTEIAGLRADLNAWVERSQNRVRESVAAVPTVDPIPPVAPPSPIVTEVPSEAPVEDPMVLAFFRKQAPERLTTLRDARSRGDHEKVQRVVHSLKPQLVSLEPGLVELCARITASGAHDRPDRWNADLDALMSAVERLLANG